MLPSTDTVRFAAGACEARSRSEKEAMSGASSTTSDEEIDRNPLLPEGLRRDASIFFVAPPRRYSDIDSSERLESEGVALATNIIVSVEVST